LFATDTVSVIELAMAVEKSAVADKYALEQSTLTERAGTDEEQRMPPHA
jgi:hypothetical protein